MTLLDHLWAGWRASYVESFGPAGGAGEGTPAPASTEAPPLASRLAGSRTAVGNSACVFCAILAAGELSERERMIVWRGASVVAILNAYPYSSGHLMVMPVRHLQDLEELSADESAELWESTRRAAGAVKGAYHPEGLNLGLNLGRAAGAGIPGHLHVHVVPRWVGDTNFMTTAASARVLPESLADTWDKLRAAWR